MIIWHSDGVWDKGKRLVSFMSIEMVSERGSFLALLCNNTKLCFHLFHNFEEPVSIWCGILPDLFQLLPNIRIKVLSPLFYIILPVLSRGCIVKCSQSKVRSARFSRYVP
jgi:hypothetical protein